MKDLSLNRTLYCAVWLASAFWMGVVVAMAQVPERTEDLPIASIPEQEMELKRLVITDDEGRPKMVLRTIEGRAALIVLEAEGNWTLVATGKTEREAVLDYLKSKK